MIVIQKERLLVKVAKSKKFLCKNSPYLRSPCSEIVYIQ